MSEMRAHALLTGPYQILSFDEGVRVGAMWVWAANPQGALRLVSVVRSWQRMFE